MCEHCNYLISLSISSSLKDSTWPVNSPEAFSDQILW